MIEGRICESFVLSNWKRFACAKNNIYMFKKMINWRVKDERKRKRQTFFLTSSGRRDNKAWNCSMETFPTVWKVETCVRYNWEKKLLPCAEPTKLKKKWRTWSLDTAKTRGKFHYFFFAPLHSVYTFQIRKKTQSLDTRKKAHFVYFLLKRCNLKSMEKIKSTQCLNEWNAMKKVFRILRRKKRRNKEEKMKKI